MGELAHEGRPALLETTCQLIRSQSPASAQPQLLVEQGVCPPPSMQSSQVVHGQAGLVGGAARYCAAGPRPPQVFQEENGVTGLGVNLASEATRSGHRSEWGELRVEA